MLKNVWYKNHLILNLGTFLLPLAHTHPSDIRASSRFSHSLITKYWGTEMKYFLLWV